MAGAARLSVAGCSGEVDGVFGDWGGDRTPEGMKAGAAHFSFVDRVRGVVGGFGFWTGGVGGGRGVSFLKRLRLARRSCFMQSSLVGRWLGGIFGCGGCG